VTAFAVLAVGLTAMVALRLLVDEVAYRRTRRRPPGPTRRPFRDPRDDGGSW
jgi:hypothetical protein